MYTYVCVYARACAHLLNLLCLVSCLCCWSDSFSNLTLLVSATYQSPYVLLYLPPVVPQPVPENTDFSGPSPDPFWCTVPPHTAQTVADSRVAVRLCFEIGIRDLW